MRGSISAMIRIWPFLRAMIGTLLWVRKNMLDLFFSVVMFLCFSSFFMFLVFDMIFIVLCRSHIEAADRYVSAHMEGCITFSCGPKWHRWR